jgi:hypothetical protein
MTYTKKQFIEDVKKEARGLRKHATKEELAQLDFKNFDPLNEDDCIYGQCGGSCRSRRAVELITKCCRRFVKNEVYIALSEAASLDDAMAGINRALNGERSESPYTIEYISMIETYIATPDAKNKNLIDYLKGNRNDLVL